MAIPVATTTIAVLRVAEDATRDPYDPQPDAAEVATGVRAHISTSRGRESVEGGSQSVTDFRLSCDQFAAGLLHEDTVVDEQSGEVYDVVWSVSRDGLGLDHFQAGLVQISGVVGGGNADRR